MKTFLLRVSGETLQALRSLASELDEIGRVDGKMKNEFQEASQNQLVFAAVRLARKEVIRCANAQAGGPPFANQAEEDGMRRWIAKHPAAGGIGGVAH